MAESSGKLHGSCHCGAIRLRLSELPTHVIDCNCSICRRNGARWAICEMAAVEVSADGELQAYVWGKRSIRTLRCAGCGCVTHWEPASPEAGTRVGVNMRNFEPAKIVDLRIRRFDGASTWKYLD